MLSAFIDDGYNRDGVIKAEPRVWPQINFTYRPMTSSESVEHQVKAKNLDDVAWHKLLCQSLAGKLVSWDVKTRKGESVAISPENIQSLLQPVVLRLWQIVRGDAADDGADEGNLQPV